MAGKKKAKTNLVGNSGLASSKQNTDTHKKDVPCSKAMTFPEGNDSPSCSRTLGESDSWSAPTPRIGTNQQTTCSSKKCDKTLDSECSLPATPAVRQPSKRFKLHKVDFDDVCYNIKPRNTEDDTSCVRVMLIGFVAGKFPGRKAIDDECKAWRVKYQLHFHQNGWIVIKFQSGEDRDRVLREGPYSVFSRPFLLEPLPKFFTFGKRGVSKVPVWARFPGLPYDMWNDDDLSEVGSRLGVPLHSDHHTYSKEKLAFARCLVEVDLSKELRASVPCRKPDGEVFEQRVVFESVPKFCTSCSRIGHVNSRCPLLKPGPSVPESKTPGIVSKGKYGKAKGGETLAQPAAKKQAVHTRFVDDEGEEETPGSPAAQQETQATNLGEKGRYVVPAKRSKADESEILSSKAKVSFANSAPAVNLCEFESDSFWNLPSVEGNKDSSGSLDSDSGPVSPAPKSPKEVKEARKKKVSRPTQPEKEDGCETVAHSVPKVLPLTSPQISIGKDVPWCSDDGDTDLLDPKAKEVADLLGFSKPVVTKSDSVTHSEESKEDNPSSERDTGYRSYRGSFRGCHKYGSKRRHKNGNNHVREWRN